MNINSITGSNSIIDTLKTSQAGLDGEGFEEALQTALELNDDKKLKEACQQIETYMLKSIFKQMKKSTELGERLLPKGDYEEMFEDYMIDEQCKNLTKAGGIGLANMMYKQMSGVSAQSSSIVDTEI